MKAALAAILLLPALFAGFAGGGYFLESDERAPGCEWLRNGDVVFVEGRTWRSFFVRMARTAGLAPVSRFSHVGIVRVLGGLPCVIHASPEDGVVKLESAEKFLSPSRIGGSGVFRLRADDCIAEAASSAAWDYFTRGSVFDRAFDMSTEDEIYCTELIWLAYRKVGVDLVDGTPLYDSSLYGRVMLPVDLSRSDRLARVEDAGRLLSRDTQAPR